MQTFVETDCTFEHNGHTFTANGAAIYGDRIVCYAKAPDGPQPTRQWVPKRGWTFTDWHGNKLGDGFVTSHWCLPGLFGTQILSFSVTLTDGRRYYCRGQGDGMVATGRLYKDCAIA